MRSTATDADSTRRARAEAIATKIYASDRTRLLRIATRNALNPDDAEDALQDSFLIFVRKYDPDIGAPVAWLTTVLKRECWARRRREHLDRRAGLNGDQEDVDRLLDSLPDSAHSPHDAAELAELVKQTRDQLAQLKPQERRALSLLALGFTYKEIGEITGWTYTKINRCIAEGRTRLRELVASNEAAEEAAAP